MCNSRRAEFVSVCLESVCRKLRCKGSLFVDARAALPRSTSGLSLRNLRSDEANPTLSALKKQDSLTSFLSSFGFLLKACGGKRLSCYTSSVPTRKRTCEAGTLNKHF